MAAALLFAYWLGGAPNAFAKLLFIEFCWVCWLPPPKLSELNGSELPLFAAALFYGAEGIAPNPPVKAFEPPKVG